MCGDSSEVVWSRDCLVVRRILSERIMDDELRQLGERSLISWAASERSPARSLCLWRALFQLSVDDELAARVGLEKGISQM